MTTALQIRFTTLVLALASLALLVFGVLNYQQQGRFQLPEDGVSWLDSNQGVKAWIVTQDGPGYRAGVREGDILEAIDGQPIHHAVDATKAIFAAGVWSKAAYDLNRQGESFETAVLITPQSEPKPVRGYLELVGLLYLAIGAFILIRRWSAPRSLHFYVFCVASFVLYTFHYTGKLNAFDWTVYWLNVVAWIAQPALFLHFCLSYPERTKWLGERRAVVPMLYLAGAALLAFHVALSAGMVTLPYPGTAARWLLDRVELAYLVACFVAGAAVLEHSYRHATTLLLKQQLKWLTRGTLVAIVPFGILYAVPYALGFVPTAWMNFSVLTLIFLPLTFGYAILHYRLMDVDIIFRRGIAYTLATAAIVGLYFGVIALFADVFRNHIGITSHTGWIVAIVVTAVLFQPVVNWIQERLERVFNPHHYDYRRMLLDFARELTSEVNVDRLLDEVTERVAETLGVERVAIFRALDFAGESHKGGGFRLVKSLGLAPRGKLDLSFLDPSRAELSKGYLFFDSVRRPLNATPAARATIAQLDLHYYLPFKVKDRTLGYLGLGKTRGGDFLSSEDVDLLHTICGSVAIALENAQLYRSLEQKALQYQALKDFNENIIESINAGVLASNLEDRVEAWNSALEKLYDLPREEAVGKKLAEVFPPELMAELPRVSEQTPSLSLYKFHLETRAGRRLIVNVSTAPLRGKEGEVLGRLLIFNDLTERVNLEDQLVQAEKLSSIGLLAAGVAHEVNTPLAVVTSQAQMLTRQWPPEESAKGALDRIVKAAFRASEIVNSLLKFSRVSGSEYVDMDLNKVIRETLSLVDPMLRASRISLNLQLTPALPAVYGNYGKLQQVFMNLVMNARDAMPRGGELTVSTECEDSTVRAEVADNGVGISPEHLNKIFDPFFTTKSTSRGTGLGLAVTYGLIREHSGTIGVESAVGRGTTFRLEFPMARKAVNVS
ncbi:MAG TPA: ATP-binding protein [Terriglobia bacterium]|nr:ATP-binding protein [Terriglobia bacterium]